MAYCTVDDLRYLVSTDKELDLLIDSSQQANACIEAASETVDMYIRPSSIASGMARDLTACIAIYKLFMRKNSEVPPSITQQYAEAMQTLNDLKNKKLIAADATANFPRSVISAVGRKTKYWSGNTDSPELPY